jgi:hypothetical protein
MKITVQVFVLSDVLGVEFTVGQLRRLSGEVVSSHPATGSSCSPAQAMGKLVEGRQLGAEGSTYQACTAGE